MLTRISLDFSSCKHGRGLGLGVFRVADLGVCKYNCDLNPEKPC